MSRNGHPVLRGVGLAAAVLLAGTASLFGAASASAAPATCADGSSPAPSTTVTCAVPGGYTLAVPAGVTTVDLDAIAGGGGAGYPARSHVGGDAAQVTGTLTLPAGTAFLYVIVGAGGAGNNHGFGYGGGGSGVFALDGDSALLAKLAIAGAGGGGAYNGDGGDAGMPGTSENSSFAAPGQPGVGSAGGAGGPGNYSAGGTGANDDPATLSLASGGAGGTYPNNSGGGSGGGGYGGGGGGASGNQGVLNIYQAGGGGGSSLASAALGNPSIALAPNTGGEQLPGLLAGDGADGTVTLSFHAAAVPGAPTGVSASAGDAQATVSFTTPAFAGSSPITSYTATSAPGGLTGVCTSSPCTVAGLTNGTAYQFTVTATNGAGPSAASGLSSTVVPSTTPGAPRGVRVVFGDRSAVVTFDPPASDGGSPITGYTVISDTDGTTATCLSSPCTVSGLTNGRPYSFHVIARNAVGASSVSTSSTLGTPAAAVVPPTGTTPTAPDRVEPSTGSALASTGPANSSSAFAAGALLLGAGLLTLVVARRRRRRA